MSWNHFYTWISAEEPVTIRWFVGRLSEFNVGSLVKRQIFIQLPILLPWESIFAGFSNRKIRITCFKICFCCNIYWAELSFAEIENCHTYCNKKFYLRLFLRENFGKFFRRLIIVAHTLKMLFDWHWLFLKWSLSQKELIPCLEVKIMWISNSSRHKSGIASIPTKKV